MRQASVGFHCPECTKAGAQKVLRPGDLGASGTISRALIYVNVAVFLLVVGTGGTMLSGGGDIWEDGVLWGPFVDPNGPFFNARGEWWRLFTGGFLHVGAFHLAMNMYALWILGPQLESVLRARWFLTVYFVSLVTGSCGVLLLSPGSPTAGASGAIFGLLGLAVVVQRARGIDPWASGLGMVVLINLMLTFSIPQISIGGHLGGLVGGAVIGWLYVEVGVRTRRDALAFALSLALGVAAFAAGLWGATQWPNSI